MLILLIRWPSSYPVCTVQGRYDEVLASSRLIRGSFARYRCGAGIALAGIFTILDISTWFDSDSPEAMTVTAIGSRKTRPSIPSRATAAR